MTGRVRRTAVVGTVVVAFAACAGGAGADDDPSAYTDPAPRPVQEEQAAKAVSRALRDDGVRAPVTATDVRVGVVVERARPSTATVRPERERVRPALSIELTATGLLPSLRAGVARPTDAAVPNAIPLALGAVLAAVAAGAFTLGRR